MSLLDLVQNPNQVAVSTTVQVLINGVFVGVVQSLEPSQTRSTVPVRGIGIGDMQLERVWGVSEYTLTVQKMALFKKFLFDALGYAANFRMISELQAPVDIMEQIIMPDKSESRTTLYVGCYLNNYTAPRTIAGDLIIMESATFDVTSINDTKFNPNSFTPQI